MELTSKGIYPKLKNAGVKWEEKLKLAQWAWDCEDCFIPNKQQLLIDWIIQELITTNKKGYRSSNGELKEGKWTFLLHILQSKELREAKIPVTLKPQLLQVFTESFSQGEHTTENSVLVVITRCCYSILSSSQLARPLLTKFEGYVSFLSSLLSSFTPICQNKDQLLFSLLEISLQKFLDLQRQQANQRKVFVSTCQQLLKPMVTLRHRLLMSSGVGVELLVTEHLMKVQSLLGLALERSFFHKDHLPEYPQALRAVKNTKREEADEPASKKPCISSYPKLLFDSLRELSSETSLEDDVEGRRAADSAVLCSLPFLFEAFVKSNRKAGSPSGRGTEFDFFTEACHMLCSFDGNHNNFIDSIPLVLQLLNCLASFDVYQVADDRANGSAQFNWLSRLIETIVKEPECGELKFQCFDVLMKLNHLLVEPHLEEIWKMIWKAENDGNEARNALTASLISTYCKLRQFDKLVVAVVASFRDGDQSSCAPTCLPSHFSRKFSKAIQGLPIGQTTAIWQILYEEVTAVHVKRISSITAESSAKKSKNKRPRLPGEVMNWFKGLELVVNIFSLFLLNVSVEGICERHRKSATTPSIATLFNRTTTEVLCQLVEMTSEIAMSRFSALLLRFSLGELDIYLRNIKLVEENDEATSMLSSSKVMHCLVPVGDTEESSAAERDARVILLQNAICIQRIRNLLRAGNDFSHGAGAKELNFLLSFFSTSLDDAADLKALWDGEICSVTWENVLIARWDLIRRNAVIILPLLSADQQLKVAHLLVKSVGIHGSPGAVTPGYITLSDVSMRMIQSAEFHEIPLMQSSLLIALLIQLHHALFIPHSDGNTVTSRLSKILGALATTAFSTDQNHKQQECVETNCVDGQRDNDDDVDNGHEDDDGDDDDNGDKDGDDDDDDDDDVGNGHNSDSAIDKDEEAKEFRRFETKREQVGEKFQPFAFLGCELCEILSGVTTSDAPIVVATNVPDTLQLLKTLYRFALDWLSDENHIRCFIGLLACDVILYLQCVEEPTFVRLETLSLNRKLLKVLFDGCRRRRRFILHHVMDLRALQSWLYNSATKVWQKYYQVYSAGLSMVVDDTSNLLSGVCRCSLKFSALSASVNTILPDKLRNELRSITSELQHCTKSGAEGIMAANQVVLTVTRGALWVCEETVTNTISSKKAIRTCAAHALLLGPSLLELLKTVFMLTRKSRKRKKTRDAQDISCWFDILSNSPALLDSFTSLLHIYSISQQSRKLLLVKEEFRKWEWHDVFRFILTGVIHHLYGKPLPVEESERQAVQSCLRFLQVVCVSWLHANLLLPEYFHIRLLASALHFLSSLELNNSHLESATSHRNKESGKQCVTDGSATNVSRVTNQTLTDKKHISDKAYDLLVSLFDGCESASLPELLQGLCDEITARRIHEDCLQRIAVALSVWSRLLSGRIIKDRKKELRPKLPQILFAVQFVLQELKDDSEITTLALDVMVKILTLGKAMVLPHNALVVLHGIMMVDCTSSNTRFPRLFQAQFSLLSTLLFQHSEAVYGAIHAFINCVRNLLYSLLNICGGQEQLEKFPFNEAEIAEKSGNLNQAELLTCAQKMARLHQEISSHKTTFSKYSPYMIADYIHRVQNVAIPANIRDVLVPGIYCLLDICGEHEMSLLHAFLEKGGKELFSVLLADYNKYHRFKGKI